MWDASIPAYRVAMKLFHRLGAYPAWAMEDWLCEEELTNEDLRRCQFLSLRDKCSLFDSLDMFQMDPEPHAFMSRFGELAEVLELSPHVTILCLVEFGQGARNYFNIRHEQEQLLT